MISCEKCGHELDIIALNVFAYDCSDHLIHHIPKEADNNAVVVETMQNWCGYELLDEEMPDSISCPYCHKFPFEDIEVQCYDVVRLVMFKT